MRSDSLCDQFTDFLNIRAFTYAENLPLSAYHKNI